MVLEENDTTELLLIERVKEGHVDEFRHLVALHATPIRKFLAVSAPTMSTVDEIAHETFVFAYRHIEDFKTGATLRPWLRAIAWNLLRAELKRRSRDSKNKERFAEHRNTTDDLVDTPHQPSGATDELEQCLERIPDHMRRLLHLKYAEGEATTAISEALQRSADWVRTNLYRLRNQLRDCLERQKGDLAR